jgi:hypothetical protein
MRTQLMTPYAILCHEGFIYCSKKQAVIIRRTFFELAGKQHLVQKGEYDSALESFLLAFEILQNPASEKNAYALGK